jgi:hypothetical protein
MNIKEIEQMWKIASNNPHHDTNWHDPVIVKFAELVAVHEREQIGFALYDLTGKIYKNSRKPHDKMVSALCTVIFESVYDILRKRYLP